MPIDLEALYKDLHRNPELSFAEMRTAGVVEKHMLELGLSVTKGVGRTGVVAVLENGPGPVVALRADMDALPVLEQTRLDYASKKTAPDAEGHPVPVMHACGHDMHVTCLIGAIEKLVGLRAEWSGTVVAIFQPAEELISGAAEMVADGIWDRFPRPEVVFGQHVAPLPAGLLSLTDGPMMAAVDTLAVTLHGSGGHGSRPETTIDPVVAAASTVVRLQSVVAREVQPGQLAVVTVGSMHAGTKNNIIPSEATLGINVRTSDPGVRQRVMASIRRIILAEAQASGMTREPDIVLGENGPATVNDPAATQRLRQRFWQTFGEANVIDFGTASGSEDVGALSTAAGAPLVFWLLGGADPAAFAKALDAGTMDQDIPSNHSPFYAPLIQPTLNNGVEALTTAVLEWCSG